jgi:hypothetical protein
VDRNRQVLVLSLVDSMPHDPIEIPEIESQKN